MGESPSVHASAVLAGARAVLIRGSAGMGKSRLALRLIAAAQCGLLRFARLVGDDRVHLEPHHGRLLVRPTPALAGLIEVRGVGIRRIEHERFAMVGLVVDLAADDAERMPSSDQTVIHEIRLPRLGIAGDTDPLHPVIAALSTLVGDIKPRTATLRSPSRGQK
ncbi:MAG: serine kinase [Alphaproteobacteria bacterium]|nr:MAG: serine kinase [Alphaproteobacteria bacterium]